MTVQWVDVSARARGLRTHLLPRAILEDLARAPDLGTLRQRLADAGFAVGESALPDPAELELGIRRRAAARLGVLSRWLGTRTEAVAVIFGDEDRRSLRAILRGAAAGVAPETRLAGTIATPTLPERALEELAARGKPREIAMLLALWKHPFGRALLAATDPEHPDLARMELAVHRAFAETASRGARRGGAALRAFVTETIDLLNVEASLLLAGTEHELPLDEMFLPGGSRLSHALFRRAAAAAGASEAAATVGPAFAHSGFGGAIRAAERDLAGFDRALLAARIRIWRRRVLHDPLGPAPLLEYVLRLRAELLQLRDLVWTAVVGAPAAHRLERLLPA
jgi:vacuolar-type H+-ATPase subunit C/Vma6